MVENIDRLFEALSQIRILNVRDINTIYYLLSQICNVLYPMMDDDEKKKHNKLDKKVMDEMYRRNKGSKQTYFVRYSNEWERELRVFTKKKQDEGEFTPGAV